MSAKEKMKEIAQTISEKTKEYAPVVKEKIVIGYNKSKDFTLYVLMPKVKEGVQDLKTKIVDFQEKHAEKSAQKKTTPSEHYTTKKPDRYTDKTPPL
jgi:hypothetical protein